jgi:glutamine amidotransferase
VVVASEPFDDEPDWVAVPDGSLLTATADGGSVVPLATPTIPSTPTSQTTLTSKGAS